MPFSATRELWLVLKARDEANRALRSFSGNVRNVGRQVQMAEALAGKADAQRLLRMQRLRGATAAEMQDTKNLIDGYDRQYRQLKVLDAQQEMHRHTMMRYNQTLNSVSATAASAGLILTGLGTASLFAIKGLINSAMTYEQQVRKTLTQVSGFKTTVDELSTIGLEVARKVAVPLEQIQPALYDIFSTVDANVPQAKMLLEAFAKAAVAGQVDIQSTARLTMGILNAFNMPLENVNRVLDIQFELVRKGAGTYEEFSATLGRAVSSAVRANQTFETLSAMVAYMTRTQAISTAMAATASARALEAFTHPKAITALTKMGVKVKDVKGNFLPLIDVLTDLRGKLEKLPTKGRLAQVAALVSIFKGAGGTIQARRFLEQVLIGPGELKDFKNILDAINTSTGEFGKAYNEMAESAASKSQLLANRWGAVKIAAGNALIPSFIKVVDWLGKMFEWFNKLPKKQQAFITKILGLVAVLTTLLGVSLLVVSGIAAIAAAIAIAGSTVLIVTGAIFGSIAAFAGLTAGIYLAWKRSQDFRDMVFDLIKYVKQLYTDAVLPAAMNIKAAWEKYIMPPLHNLWDVIKNKILPALKELYDYFKDYILPAAQEVSNWISRNLTAAFYAVGYMINSWLIPAIELATNWYHQHEGAVKNVIMVVGWLVMQLLKLSLFMAGPLAITFGAIILTITTSITMMWALAKAIEFVVNLIKSIVNWIRTWDDAGTTSFRRVAQNAIIFKDKMVAIKDTIISSFKNAVQWLYIAGQDLIMGLVNGAISKGKDAVNSIKGIANSILAGAKAALGVGSPSKEFMKIGRDSVAGFMLGFRGLNSAVPNAMNNMTRTIGTNKLLAGSSATGNNVTQTIYVYTHEINPKRHSEELGFELGARP